LIPFLIFSLLAAIPFEHSEWDRFLKKFVNDKGEVNYSAALQEPRLLNRYLTRLKRIPVKELFHWPREERMAVFINAYNAGIVRSILDSYPVKTVMNIPGLWEQRTIPVGSSSGKKKKKKVFFYSLNQIEKEVLKMEFRDEKTLFALSKGAKSSPRLRQEAYTGPHLEGQLYLAAREFVNDARQVKIEPGKKKIHLSKLFKWHADDFLFNWGDFPEGNKWAPEETAVLSFVVHYLEDAKKVEYLKEGEYKVAYLDFDWRLNEWQEAADKTNS